MYMKAPYKLMDIQLMKRNQRKEDLTYLMNVIGRS